MWLLTSALTGYEKNKLFVWERFLRGLLGFAVLSPNLSIALPALLGAGAVILAHRFLNGAPSSVDATP